jgi:hypothetical protein
LTLRDDEFQKIAHDLDLCDIGAALTTGRRRSRFLAQRRACMDRVAELNRADGLDDISDADLIAELGT